MTPQIILTRPLAQSTRFAAELSEALGDLADITLSPLLQIAPVPFDPVPDDHDVIFTSENGVAGFLAGAKVRPRKAFCVGDRTAEAAREAGFDARSASGTATDLIDLIAQDAGGAMVYARGAHVARDLRADLTAIGVPVSEVLVYTQNPLALNTQALGVIGGQAPVIFPLFSRRSMELLVSQDISQKRARCSAVCISAGVAEAAEPALFDDVHVCEAPNSRAMIGTLRALVA